MKTEATIITAIITAGITVVSSLLTTSVVIYQTRQQRKNELRKLQLSEMITKRSTLENVRKEINEVSINLKENEILKYIDLYQGKAQKFYALDYLMDESLNNDLKELKQIIASIQYNDSLGYHLSKEKGNEIFKKMCDLEKRMEKALYEKLKETEVKIQSLI